MRNSSNDPRSTAVASVRRTSRLVHAHDRVATSVITAGGLSVLAAVLGICVYLLASVWPLFEGGRASIASTAPFASDEGVVDLAIDDGALAAMEVLRDGSVRWRSIASGRVLGVDRLVDDDADAAAVVREPRLGLVAVGLGDGRVVLGEVRFSERILTEEQGAGVLGGERSLAPGESFEIAEGEAGYAAARAFTLRPLVLARTDGGALRLVGAEIEAGEPLEIGVGTGAAARVDVQVGPGGRRVLAVLREDGSGALNLVRTTRPLGGGAPRTRLTSRPLSVDVGRDGRGLPAWFLAGGDGDAAFALWADGTLERYAVAGDAMELAERLDVSPDSTLRVARMALGARTLIAGTASGRIVGGFVAGDPLSNSVDGARFVLEHDFGVSRSPIASIGIGTRDRTLVVGDDAGAASVVHLTSHKRVARVTGAHAPARVAMGGRNDALLVVAGDEAGLWSVEPGHPEASWRMLAMPIRYEGQLEPEFVYQSSSGDDAAEPKLSLTPLVFGTLKATLVAMLFAVPVGVLAAIYSSEFLDRRAHAIVKPTVEMMASLPSVVLGFVAAMVVAPLMSKILPGVLLGLIVVPLGVLLAAHLWELLPARVARRMPGLWHVAAVGAVMVVSSLAAVGLGSWGERVLFRPSNADVLVLSGSVEPVAAKDAPAWVGRRDVLPGELQRRLRRAGMDFRDGSVVRPIAASDEQVREMRAALEASGVRAWLDGKFGAAWPGWFVAMLVPGLVVAWILRAWWVGQGGARGGSSTARDAALSALASFVLTAVGSIALAAGVAWALSAAGLDPRDSIFGPFSVRNTLVVGLIMGFAVVPIIYTISEDALSAVPHALRSASLGAGATPWQTAIRVVLPVAGSGIFSACMIGLGRAVGETMIVLMATGNTPTLDVNVFEGMRTLSANIAVELPEAAKGSTHYRVLFLCGMVLFVMTFVINTTAEVVRQRFRRRNAAL
ncbi:MAG: ABC transporter permease subunit [Phycisphaerales bacterium]|jgi:phosphate transport system permease protein|nr:ABC transporter permease subunit [Phycisphaerales bacterium]